MSVTAVPLRPIQKGSVSRLWLAMLLVMAVAALLTWNGLRQFGKTDSGLRYQILAEGSADHPARDDFTVLSYKGMLPDGTVFDENEKAPMDLSSVVPGFSEAATLIGKGGKLRVEIPAALGYGANPQPGSPIPPNSPLIFEIKLHEFYTRQQVMEMQRQQQMMQMLQQQMGGQGGVPDGTPPAPEGPPQP